MLIKEFETTTRNFVWPGRTTTHNHSSINRYGVCALKEEGGLGVIAFADLNTALLRKFAWNVITKHCMEINLLRGCYLSDPRMILTAGPHYSILRGMEIPTLINNCILEDKSSVYFWLDDS